MSKALNLTDMLWQRNDAAGQDRAKEAGNPQGASRAPAKRAKADFVPEQPAAPAPGADRGGTVKSFHERVKESQDRLSRKDHRFFKQPGRADNAQPEGGDDQARRATRPGRTDRPERAAGQGRGMDKAESRMETAKAARKAGPKACAPDASSEAAVDVPREESADGIRDLRPLSLHRDAQGGENIPQGDADYADAEEQDALEARLEALGIEAEPGQLRDPAFLAEMLWQIDAIPLAAPAAPSPSPATAVSEDVMAMLPIGDGIDWAADLEPGAMAQAPALDAETPAAPADLAAAIEAVETSRPAAGNAGLAAAAAEPEAAAGAGAIADASIGEGTPADGMAVAGDFDWTAVEEPEREEIAALLRDKLALIADKPEMRAGPEGPRAEAPDLPVSVHWARSGADRPLPEAVADAEAVLADPDRLRVMQNAGLEDALTRENAFLALERDLESAPSPDGEEPAEDRAGAGAGAMAAFRKTAGDDARDPSSDLFGRQGGAGADGEAFGNRGAAEAPRETGATPFLSSLETARASEARLAQAKPPVPHAHAPTEPGVLAQIARKFSALGVRGSEEIRIQLEPEHLGKVRIAIEMRGEGLTARISVENESVRQMVDQNLAALKESLEGQGVKIQGMEVSVEQRHASLFNPDGSNAREFFHRRGGSGGGADGAEAPAQDIAEADTGRRMGYNTMEYIA